MVETLKESDLYNWFDYTTNDTVETWKLKSYNNDTKTAFIVFRYNNNWEKWTNYTAQWCKYSDIARCSD